VRVAVTGAAGFVGRHVVRQLAARGADVVAVLRPASNISELSGVNKLVQIDVAAPPADAYDAMGRPDCLIHLAWGGLPNYRSLHHFETELPSHYRFLRQLIDEGLPNVVVSGTCFEYGMQSGALSEDIPCVPDNPYGFAKDSLRRQLQMFKARSGFKLTWARLFYVYGEGQASNSLYPLLKAAAERGDERFDMSGGEQLRDYLPIRTTADDLARLALLNRDNGIVNVCSGQPISVRRLVEGWLLENGWTMQLNLGHYPYPDYEPLAFWGNGNRLKSLLED
jgi:dTDP-6-deoxy-L-talose 4-dehydrogenase (NAD+)